MSKIIIISLCTTGVMRDHFIYYARKFSCYSELYCVTNDNVSNDELTAIETLNVRYKRNEKLGYFSLKKIKLIKNFVKKINPDLVYVFTPHPANILLARFLKKYLLIFQVHDPEPHSHTALLDRVVLKMQLKRYYKYANKLIVCGDSLKKQITHKYPKLEKKILVYPFGVIDSLKFDKKPVKEKYDILFFGRIEYYKGIDILIEAMSLLNNKYSCIMIGKGDLNTACNQKNIELSKNITFINQYISDQQLIDYINESKIVVLPYRDATGSFTIGCSFYYGKPVIATNVGTFPEYVLDGGLIVERENPKALAQALESVLSNDEYRKQLSINAKKVYDSRYVLDNIIRATYNDFLTFIEANEL